MGYRELCFKHHDRECWVCGASEDAEENPDRARAYIEVHHIRGRWGEDTLDNLVPLCVDCHARVHSEERQEGDLAKLQAVLWAHDPSYPESTTQATFVFEGGELQFRGQGRKG